MALKPGKPHPPCSTIMVFPAMNMPVNGLLIPQGGGDAIPLIRPQLVMGRRESCDICLRFSNVSGVHCKLTFKDGCWIIEDLNSTNGIKVNRDRVQRKVLQPGDTITIAKRDYVIQYEMDANARTGLQEEVEDITSQSLLEKAGLTKPRKSSSGKPSPRSLEEMFPDEEDDDD